MRKCLVLYGKANIGKTTTLKNVIDILSKNGAKELNKIYSGQKEKVVILKYKNKKIGITTRGDTEELLNSDLGELCNNCDFCICAARSYGNTWKSIKKYYSEVVWMNKIFLNPIQLEDAIYDIERINKMQAEIIVEGIEVIVKGK